MRNRLLLALALVAAFAFSTFFPPDAQAIWLDTYTVYFSDCAGSNINGWRWRECNGTITQSGTLSGHWKLNDWYDCSTGDQGYDWYEWCGGSWVYRGSGYQTPNCGC
ncbi:MAG TPA: hypothetical protein VGF69_14955 [Thermoanaerobaculia bacterium]|jgi:hypothetical protein